MKTLIISMVLGFIIVNLFVALMTFDGILSETRLREDAKDLLILIGSGYAVAMLSFLWGTFCLPCLASISNWHTNR